MAGVQANSSSSPLASEDASECESANEFDGQPEPTSVARKANANEDRWPLPLVVGRQRTASQSTSTSIGSWAAAAVKSPTLPGKLCYYNTVPCAASPFL